MQLYRAAFGFAGTYQCATIPKLQKIKQQGHKVRLSAAILVGLFSLRIHASPWIGTVDETLHEDLRTLVDYQVVDAVAISYPVPWKGIGEQLRNIDPANLADPAQQAAIRLLHYYHQQQEGKLRQFTRLYGTNEAVRFDGLSSAQGRSGQLSHQAEAFAGHWSAQLQANWNEGGDVNLDGSYLAFQLGGWVVKGGATDQFWGPAHGSSLILSTNARPVPTIGIFRGQATQSDSKWLSWLGPWYASAELGQLESNRSVPETKLWRTRLTVKPLTGLTLGFSWAAMWGGEGQPNSWGDFVDVLSFKTQCINGMESCDPALETTNGNHIAGFDMEYTFHLLSRPWSVYLQRIGEDAVDGYRVTDNANLAGISTYVGPLKVYIEHSDTNIACNGDGNAATNCYYEHSIYSTGYRYRGRAIGSTFDSDATALTAGVKWHSASGKSAALSLTKAELNEDGTRPSPVLNGYSSEDLIYLQGYYQQSFRDFLIKLGATVEDRDLPDNSTMDYSVYLDIRYAWN